MAKTRTHRFVITLTFDRKCTQEFALHEARNEIHGEHYTESVHPEPETFRVRSIRRAPRVRR